MTSLGVLFGASFFKKRQPDCLGDVSLNPRKDRIAWDLDGRIAVAFPAEND